MTKLPDSNNPGTEKPKEYSAWLGFARREIRPGRTVRIHILWPRVLVLLMVLLGATWMAKSWGLYLFFRNVREFEDVSFMDMVFFPLNRGNVRVQQGDYQIEQGALALEREDYRRAFSLLREGVARSPANLEGRMLLARLYAGWRPDLASELLVDGLEHGVQDSAYLRLLTRLLLDQRQDERLLDLTEDLLASELTDEGRRLLLVARLQSAMYLGRYAIVRSTFESSDLDRSLEGVLLGTRIYARTGRAGDAIAVLEAALASLPEDRADPVYEQLISIYKSQEEFGKAREAALNMMLAKPLEWRPRLLLVDILSASGMLERRDRELESVIREFRENQQAMETLAQLSADYGNVEAAIRLYEIALENGFSLSLFSLTLAESLVQDGQYQRAIDLCNELSNEDPSWLPGVQGAFNAIRSLAYYGNGNQELGALYLNNFLESERANEAQLFQTARRFRQMGQDPQALRLLREAHERDTSNERILATMIEVEMDLGIFFSLDEHLESLLGLRRPDYDALEGILGRLRSDRFLFTTNRAELLQELQSALEERQLMQDWDIWQATDSPEQAS